MSHADEIARGERFGFGANWRRFLAVVDDERVSRAEASLRDMLKLDDLQGQRFLDIGCGSGLFSLAARRLGAQVHSFDYDPASVACAEALRDRFQGGADPQWTIEAGSVLDLDYLQSLQSFDVVYSWGVLHHTGAMWTALDNALGPLAPEGRLLVAIYNDQGHISRRWTAVKQVYCSSRAGQGAVLASFVPWFFWRGVAVDLLSRKNPARRYLDYHRERGMSLVHDWVDWLGGYPFEVATPDAVIDFFHQRGLQLDRLKTVGPEMGCNEFLFRRRAPAPD